VDCDVLLLIGRCPIFLKETAMRRQRPLRTLKAPIEAPDHFTVEQAREAVLAVMAERGETPRPDIVERARDPRPDRSAKRANERRPVIRRRKRYPPILEPACPPTHFTVEEARRAVREVLEEDRLAAEERRRRRTAKRDGTARGTAG
jgi:hypothetical protein